MSSGQPKTVPQAPVPAKKAAGTPSYPAGGSSAAKKSARSSKVPITAKQMPLSGNPADSLYNNRPQTLNANLNPQLHGATGPEVMNVLPQTQGRSAGVNSVEELTELYQRQLSDVTRSHGALEDDQERLAKLMKSVNAGLAGAGTSTSVMIVKEGLDLRLREFEEDCRRVRHTERNLQRKIDNIAVEQEVQILEMTGICDQRVLRCLKEKQRQLESQQLELDQLRFEKETLEDESRRLRQMVRYGNFPVIGQESAAGQPTTDKRMHGGWEGELGRASRKFDRNSTFADEFAPVPKSARAGASMAPQHQNSFPPKWTEEEREQETQKLRVQAARNRGENAPMKVGSSSSSGGTFKFLAFQYLDESFERKNI